MKTLTIYGFNVSTPRGLYWTSVTANSMKQARAEAKAKFPDAKTLSCNGKATQVINK